MGPNDLSMTHHGRIFARRNGTGWGLGLSKYNETKNNDNTILNFGQTYLIMLKYLFSIDSTSDDQVMLYAYESGIPSSEPGDPVITIGPIGFGTGGDPLNIGAVCIRQGSNTATGYIDGIRVDTSWSNVISTSVKSQSHALPAKLILEQNYPNPFNPSTTLRFSLPSTNRAVLKIFNLIGQKVATLFDDVAQEEIIYTVCFDGAYFPTGLYIARLEQMGRQVTRKMMLTK
jgi:hypothetical protein